MSSFHKTFLGFFGVGIETDLDGYTHTTAAEWGTAPMGFTPYCWQVHRLDQWCDEMAARVAEQLEEAYAASVEARRRVEEADGIDAWLAASIGKRTGKKAAYVNGAGWYDCYEADGTFLGTVGSENEAREEYGCAVCSQD